MDAADGELRELVFARLAERDLARAVAELVATRSDPPGDEDAVAAALAGVAGRWGLAARVERVADGRSNVHVTTGEPAVDGPDVLMVGHLDTVPADPAGWTVDPFAGRVVDGNVWGRGSVDMKGGLGAMLAALAALHDVTPERAARAQLYAVAGEEVDCLGSRTLVATGRLPAARCLVVGEPTGLQVVAAHEGACASRWSSTDARPTAPDPSWAPTPSPPWRASSRRARPSSCPRSRRTRPRPGHGERQPDQRRHRGERRARPVPGRPWTSARCPATTTTRSEGWSSGRWQARSTASRA